MPITIDGRRFEHFRDAEAYIRKHKRHIKSPGGYVHRIEQAQRGREVNAKLKKRRKGG